MKNVEQLSLFDDLEPVVSRPVMFETSVEVEPMADTGPEIVTIYTDGACSGNPGPGGCAAIVQRGKAKKELSQGYRRTTNNRMEMMALVIALETIERESDLIIYSDSKYLINSFEKGWLRNWKRSGWMTKSKKSVKNTDLWKRLDTLLAPHQSKFIWVKGHSDHAENNRCDELAVGAKSGPNLLIDDYVEPADDATCSAG